MLIGSALVFGALKWRKGLLSTVACYWGIVLGFLVGFFLVYSRHIDIIAILITTIMGAIIFPVLTYSVPAINRFVLGFLITGKLSYMITTYMWKEGYIELRVATALPVVLAIIFGLIFMLMSQLSVLPFALGCIFIGASQVAPVISKFINQVEFGITQDYSLLFDPRDLIFAMFNIELTDGWTLFFMIVFMGLGLPYQLNYIKQQGYTYDTPIIVFETDSKNMSGKIIS